MCSTPIVITRNRTIRRRYFVGSNRRWERYNPSPVNRIEDLMDTSFSMDWNTLLYENNRGKRGRPFKTPSAFITFLAKLRAAYGVHFRSLEWIARIFSRIVSINSICCTNIFIGIKKIVSMLPDTCKERLIVQPIQQASRSQYVETILDQNGRGKEKDGTNSMLSYQYMMSL
jgi:hypothetical protein